MVFAAILFAAALIAPSLAAPVVTDIQIRSPNNSKSRSNFPQIFFLFFPLLTFRLTNSTEVIASLFGWNWDSVGKECSFLASAGYGYVQGTF